MRLSLAGQVARDFFHVRPKAERKHLVRFIKNEDLGRAEVHSVVFEVVEDSARRTDDDMGAFLESCELGAVRDAAINGQSANATVLPESVQIHRDLIRELASRQQDDGLSLREFRVDGFDDRDTESTGLPATGHGLDD